MGRVSVGTRVPTEWVQELDDRASKLGTDRAGVIAAAIASELGKPAPVSIDVRVRALEVRLQQMSAALAAAGLH